MTLPGNPLFSFYTNRDCMRTDSKVLYAGL
jgi:hypothetical protein